MPLPIPSKELEDWGKIRVQNKGNNVISRSLNIEYKLCTNQCGKYSETK
jgi:hypothetical protein